MNNNFLQSTFLVWFVLWKIRHLAAENGSCSVLSIGVTSCFLLLDEINLEPVFFLVWRRLLVEITPSGVCIIKTVSGLGALQKKKKKKTTWLRWKAESKIRRYQITLYFCHWKKTIVGEKQKLQRTWWQGGWLIFHSHNWGSHTCGKHNKRPFLLSACHFSLNNATAYNGEKFSKIFPDKTIIMC